MLITKPQHCEGCTCSGYSKEQVFSLLEEYANNLRERQLRDHEKWLRKQNDSEAKRFDSVREHLVPATPREYGAWLKGFLETGGTIRYERDYGIGRIYKAVSDFDLGEGFYGSSSFDVIVPEGIKFLGGNSGHCNVYFMDGFRTENLLTVSLYAGIEKYL